MAPYETDDSTDTGEVDELRAGRRRAARYIVPVTVVGVAAATIGLVPALADSGDPNLPKITAQQLLDKVAKSDVQQLSGTVKISTDLGLPDLGGLESSLMSGATKSGDGSSADPTAKLTELATGSHTLRVAADGPDKQKVSLLENAAEYSLIHNGKDVWGYDSQSNEVFHATTSADTSKGDETRATPKGLTDEALKSVDSTTSVTVDGTEHVAGRDAYKLLIKPKQSGTTVGTISVAVDAKTGLPLKFTLTPASGGAAVVDVGFTQLSLAKPAASTFDFKTPKGAKVTTEDSPAKATPDHSAPFGKDDKTNKADKGLGKSADDPTVIGKGWNSIAVFETGGQGIPTGSSSGGGDLGGFLSSLGDQVKGSFGSGTVYSTRLINALVTDDGKVYVGAVTKSALVKAADAAK
ncbi:LolA family protein [Streptomyces sp. NPDC001100]